MLEAIQRGGDFPPLVMVHGLYGVMPIGHPLSRVLGPDQPFATAVPEALAAKPGAVHVSV